MGAVVVQTTPFQLLLDFLLDLTGKVVKSAENHQHSRFNSGGEVKVNYDGGAMSPLTFPHFMEILFWDPG